MFWTRLWRDREKWLLRWRAASQTLVIVWCGASDLRACGQWKFVLLIIDTSIYGIRRVVVKGKRDEIGGLI